MGRLIKTDIWDKTGSIEKGLKVLIKVFIFFELPVTPIESTIGVIGMGSILDSNDKCNWLLQNLKHNVMLV